MEQTVLDVAARIKTRQDVSLAHTLIGERPAAQPAHPERIEPLVRQLLIEQGEDIISKPRSTHKNIPLSIGWPSICMGLCRCRNYWRRKSLLPVETLLFRKRPIELADAQVCGTQYQFSLGFLTIGKMSTCISIRCLWVGNCSIS